MKHRNEFLVFIFLIVFVLASSTFSITNLRFFFPVQVAGPLAVLMDDIVSDFNESHPDINVEPIYCGNYDQTMQKSVTAALGNNPPDVALLLAIDLFTLLDLDLIEEIDQFLIGEDANFTEPFYEGFMENSVLNGVTWSIPFQRSTPIFYYNKEHFKAAGLDPDDPPDTWDELQDAAEKLTVKDGRGNVVRWGFEDITDDTWTIQALVYQAGGKLANETGTEAYFDTPETAEAISFWTYMANVARIMPRHRSYGAASQDFVAGATSMMFNSTGSLRFVRDSATFDFGVAPLPGNKIRAVPTGGGNLYIFKGISEENKEAAWTFVRWLSQPTISAKWSIGTGYIPVRKDAFETKALKNYVEEFPYILVARDQLEYAKREMAFHNNSQIREIFRTALHDILDERVSLDKGLEKLQKEVNEILAPFAE